MLLIPVALLKHLTDHWAGTVAAIGSVSGVVVGCLKWCSRSAPAEHWGVHGSANWASATEAQTLVRPDGLIIGRENRKSGELLRYAGQPHLITNAPTRSGKGVDAIIPNLLTANGRSYASIRRVITRVAFRASERFGRVHALEPFVVSGVSCGADFSCLPDSIVNVAIIVAGFVKLFARSILPNVIVGLGIAAMNMDVGRDPLSPAARLPARQRLPCPLIESHRGVLALISSTMG